MAGGAVIGSLRAVLGIDTAQFEDGLKQAQKSLKATAEQLQTIGDSMSSLGSKLSLALTAPIAALGVLSSKAATESAQALAQVEAAQRSMGNASGKSTAQLQAQAGALQDLSTYDDDDILKSVTANLLTFGNVAGDVFTRAQAVVVDLSARLGQDLQSSTIQVGKALNNPLKGITALQRVGVAFSAQQKEQITNFVKQGEVAQAQGIILKELESEFGGAAKAMRDATPTAALQESFRNFSETIGGIVNQVLPPLLNVLQKVLDGFNALPPGTQGLIVALAGIAAAVGPILLLFGIVISTVGSAAAGFSALAGAGGIAGLVAATGPLLPILAGVGIALAAIGIAAGLWVANSVKQQIANQALITTMGGAKTQVDAYAAAIADEAAKHGEAAKQAKAHADEVRGLLAASVGFSRFDADLKQQKASAAAAEAKSYRANSQGTTFGASGGAAQAVVQVGASAIDDKAKELQATADAAKKGADAAAASLKTLDQQRVNPPPRRKLQVDTDDDATKAKAAHGRSVQQIQDELALEAAKARGDTAEAQRLEDQVDLQKRVRQYEEAGLKPAAARQAAESAIATLKVAQAEGVAKEVAKLEQTAALEAAQAAGDQDRVKQLQDQADLTQRIASYEAQKVPHAEAVTRATADQKAIQDGQAVAHRRALDDAQIELGIQVAQIDGETQTEASLQHQADLRALILKYEGDGLTLAQATVQAQADQAKIDAARAQARARALSDDQLDQQIKLAQLKGETGIADQLQRQADIRDRAKALGDLHPELSSDQRTAKATLDVDAASAAKLQGQVKQTFHDGIQAAMDGNLGDFFESFWKDHLLKALDNAFDRIMDQLSGVFAQLSKGGGSGGGIGSLLASGLTALLGGSKISTAINPVTSLGGDLVTSVPGLPTDLAQNIPHFATGGSFTVGGQAGVDKNLVSLKLSKGEMVNVTHGEMRSGAVAPITYAPTYNVQGYGRDIDGLKAQMAQDQATFATRVHAAAQEGFSSGKLRPVRS